MARITATNSAGYEAPIGISADPVIFTLDEGELKVLLVRRDAEPGKGLWALPGGFVGTTEDPADTALRKLEEKTGMKANAAYLEQLATYAAPGRDPRGWLPAVAYLALVPADLLPERGGAQEAEWHPVARLPRMAFDHRRIVRDGLERLRGKLWYSNVAVGLLPRHFTLGQARAVYEAIAGTAYDPGNFARDLRASGLVEEVPGKRIQAGAGRPGQAYRFRSRKLTWVERKGVGKR
jgi:ADP-ribose pyrophosphatase